MNGVQIHESKEAGVYVAGLQEDIVTSPEHVLQLLEEGERGAPRGGDAHEQELLPLPHPLPHGGASLAGMKHCSWCVFVCVWLEEGEQGRHMEVTRMLKEDFKPLPHPLQHGELGVCAAVCMLCAGICTLSARCEAMSTFRHGQWRAEAGETQMGCARILW